MNITHRKFTDRRFGNKKPFEVIRRFLNAEGIKTVECEADFWIGPDESGKEGNYERVRWLEPAGFYYQGKNGQRVFYPRKPYSCSFEVELVKALTK